MSVIKYRSEEEMKDSGIKWIGAMPKNWNLMMIKRLSRIGRGASPRPIDDQKFFDDLNGEYAWSRIADVSSSEKYLRKTKQMMSKLGANLSVKLEVNSLFLSIAGSVGKPCITKIKTCIHDGFVYFPELKPELSDYMFYIFDGGQCYKGLGKLGTQLNLNRETVGSIYLPHSSGDNEKLKIANFLDIKTAQFNSIISKKELLIKKLEEAKKSLISEVVTGKVKIVDGEMVKRQPEEMKDSGVEWLGKIPKDWEVKRIKFLLNINPSKSEISNKNIKCNFIPMNKIHNGLIETDETALIKEVYDSYTYFKNEDIIMAKVTPCFENGDIAIATKLVNGIGFGTTEINVFRVEKQYDNEFIYYTMQEQHFMRYGSSHMTGVAGLKRIPTSFFSNFKVPLPKHEDQIGLSQFINMRFKSIKNIIRMYRLQIQKLKQAKQSLISEAVTGKIDLRDWEIIEEGAMK